MSNEPTDLLERDAGLLHSRAALDNASLSDEERSVDVVASTEEIDRHGTILKANWRLAAFKDNPIVLFAHNSRELPIGTASDVRVSDGQLRAKLTFNTKELNARAEEVWQNVKAKKIRGVSVGFFPHTVTFERHDDREVMVLDDNELLEISVVPVPSNPSALAQMRTRALAAAEPKTEPTAPIPAPAPEPNPTPEPPETRNIMTTQNDPKDPTNATPSVARALGLPAGSTETDIVAAATREHELGIQIMAITGVQVSGEALGAVRGLKVKADRCDALETENVQLKAERDQQAFDALIATGTSAPVKLSPATAKHYGERFTAAKEQGRGAEIVADLKGFLAVAPTIIAQRQQPPAPGGGGSAATLVHNGKSYAEMKPLERARLAQQEPDLYRAMKQDHDSAARAS